MAIRDISIGPEAPVSEQIKKDRKDEALMKACREFESVFTYELLKSMRRTVEKCDLFHGGRAEEIYESLLDQEISKNVSGGGANSLASMLYNQLKKDDAAELEGREISFDRKGREDRLPLWPIQGRVSSGFGWRKDPFTGEDRFHAGMDLAAGEGTPVSACLDGRVIKAGYEGGYGNTVVLDHGHGLTTRYAHNRENLVAEGDWIKQGTILAEVGSTGRSTGPHLHFEVRRHGRTLDPRKFLDEGSPLQG